jgi:knotted carbamoyltransferase YgeW
MDDFAKKELEQLKQLKMDLYQKDFFLTWEKSLDEIKGILLTARIFKKMHKKGFSSRIYDTGLGISIFKDKSTRTRFSFASAVNSLGLSLMELDEEKTQVTHGETVRETSNMISFLAEVIGIRDDMYIGFGDKYQREVSGAVEQGFTGGILHQRPVVINLQSDIDHPTQAMSDLSKLVDYFGGLDNLKNKKIAMTWAYSPSYGKPLSVPQGIIGLMTRMGMDITLAYPEGYNLMPEIIEVAKENAQKSNSHFTIVNNMDEAFDKADIVYPKSWASFSIMEQRRDLLFQGDSEGLKSLEKECLAENAKHIDWECNKEKMKITNNALYMHCLPADITGVSCEKGEVSEDVFEEFIPDTYHQASFKPFIIQAMIFLAKFTDPISVLENMVNNPKKINYFK